ncbi:hypothetical protein [Ammoniphilus sp. CFH 90114]|nr:hypothetical protein [Ammoniphilus sp. CFH 90114]
MKLMVILIQWFGFKRKGKSQRSKDERLSDQLERELEKRQMDNDRYYV